MIRRLVAAAVLAASPVCAQKPRLAQPLWVLIISGMLGFRVGIVSFADWQVAVETAQVLAGIVDYPAGNPFYIYHTKLWTIVHQICALALLSGVSEAALSMFVSGLFGMVAFQGLSMIVVYALSRDVLLAIGSAFLIFFTRAAEYGVVYPIVLMGTTHTYGVLGLSTIVLVAGLLGAGCYRIGGFLLGIAPAVHLSLGAWFVVVVALAVAWDFKRVRYELRPALKYCLAGFGVTAVSLAVQLALITDAPGIDEKLAATYLSAFIGFWDAHRQPVTLTSEGVKLGLGALGLALLWLKPFAGDLQPSNLFLLRLTVVSVVSSLALALVSRIPAHLQPSLLSILMPGRVLNFGAMIAVALLCGLIGAAGKTFWSWLLTLFLTIGLLFSNRSMLWEWLPNHYQTVLLGFASERPASPPQILLTASLVLVIGSGVSRWNARRGSLNRDAKATVWTRMARAGTDAARISTFGLLACVAILTWQLPARVTFLDRTNSTIFGQAARAEGILLTGGDLHLIQLRTRRPVLLDGGGLDGLPYALEAGPEIERILRDVYEIDLFNPPEEARGLGAIPNGANQTAWERYPRERWQQIRRAYNVTQVLTYAQWILNLPVVDRDSSYVLYEIPD